jgi:hypothetical protein
MADKKPVTDREAIEAHVVALAGVVNRTSSLSPRRSQPRIGGHLAPSRHAGETRF